MRLYNTLTRRADELVPRTPGEVSMYVCGPTVQGPPHFGHARASIVPDVLRRYLEWTGLRVRHVRNVTDIEDNIIERAQAEGRMAAEVAEQYTRVWEAQIARLGVLSPHIVPRATGHITEMHELIARLVERGSAYESDGNVFFAVRTFSRYGKLSGRKVDELRSGARVEADERKRDPLDFAVWKAAKPGEPSWPSPWGPGRPGWHIECSAMAAKYLGAGFDIHAGGTDLVFPHHENEVAQFEAATGEQFARWWVHNGLLNFGTEKMSKSLGNVISLEDSITRYGANTLRMFYLAVGYRSPIDFTEPRLAEAAAGLERWQAFLRVTADLDAEPDEAIVAEARARFSAAMDDDLATPAAQAGLFDLVTAGHQHLEAGREAQAAGVRAALVELAGVLGYDLATEREEARLVAPLVTELLAEREEARARKDFAAADRIRDRLTGLGISVEDGPQGPRWHLTGG